MAAACASQGLRLLLGPCVRRVTIKGCINTPRVYTTVSEAVGNGGRYGLSCATKTYLGVLTAVTACGVIVYALDRSVVEAAHMAVGAPYLPWGFKGPMSSLDHSAIRRGWQVFKTVCSSCHSLTYVAFQDMVDVCLTEQEAREVAAEFEVEDGPNEEGQYFTRPGKLTDRIPPPFPNEEAARAANNGAYPVDLTYIMSARHDGENYIFGLLTGYMDPPAGVELLDGQNFNPYFEGGALGMAEVLQDGGVDYDDGTPAYKSQMAKDVVEFLMWTANQDWDNRKLVCFKGIGVCVILLIAIYPPFRQRMAFHKKVTVCYIPRTKNC